MKKFMTFAAMFAAVAIAFTACNKEEKPQGGNTTVTTCPDCGENLEDCTCDDFTSAVSIDGDFADWNALDASKVVSIQGNPDALYTALTSAKIYVDEVYICIYFEFDPEYITEGNAAFDIYLNEDNVDGLYDDYYVGQTGVDVLLEDGVFMEGGKFNSFNPGLFEYTLPVDQEWDWGWSEVLPADSGIATGAGNGNKYELAIVKEMLMGVELADTFSLGLMLTDIVGPDWNCVGVLPNAAMDEVNTNGKAAFVHVPNVK